MAESSYISNAYDVKTYHYLHAYILYYTLIGVKYISPHWGTPTITQVDHPLRTTNPVAPPTPSLTFRRLLYYANSPRILLGTSNVPLGPLNVRLGAYSVRCYATARWFRAVDVPVRKPHIYNYKPSQSPRKFEAFSSEDSETLESAYKRGACSAQVEADGLMTVCFDQRVCKPTFYDGHEYEVRRHLWFEKNGTKLAPVPPGLETQLECNFGHGSVVGSHFSYDNTVYTCTIDGAESSRKWLGGTQQFVRGAEHGKLEARSGNKPRDKTHLVFCVHGIGQLLSVAFEQVNFARDVDRLRQAVVASPLGEHVQVLPVMWRQKLSDDINGIRPQQLFGTRNLAADAALDFVLYMEPKNRNRILDVAAKEMVRMYHSFCKSEPNFKGKVSIIGHSLGSVLAYDLVRYSDLPFDIHSLFTLGSPLGVLELIHQSPTISLGKAKSMYNVLRLADPVAARMEPLVVKDSLKVMPKQLDSSGLIKAVQDVQGTFDKIVKVITAYTSTTGTGAGANATNTARGGAAKGTAVASTASSNTTNSSATGVSTTSVNTTSTASTDTARTETSMRAARVGPNSGDSAGGQSGTGKYKSYSSKAEYGEETISSGVRDANAAAEADNIVDEPSSSEIDLSALRTFNRHGRLDFSVPESMDLSLVLGLAGHLMYLDNPDVVRFILEELSIDPAPATSRCPDE